MKCKYYFYSNPNSGERYFAVRENEKVLQIIASIQPKKGRAYNEGITMINYNTFIGSWGWKLSEGKYIKEITKIEFDEVFNNTINKLNLLK